MPNHTVEHIAIDLLTTQPGAHQAKYEQGGQSAAMKAAV